MAYCKHFNRIQEIVNDLNEKWGRKILSLGYIGNLERWGDDRLWYIWVVDVRYTDGNRNQKSIWCEQGVDLLANKEGAARRVSEAIQAIRHFELGLEAAGALATGGSVKKAAYFDTLNEALESEGLVDLWPIGKNIEYGYTERVIVNDGTKLISIYRNNAGRYERPVHYSTV